MNFSVNKYAAFLRKILSNCRNMKLWCSFQDFFGRLLYNIATVKTFGWQAVDNGQFCFIVLITKIANFYTWNHVLRKTDRSYIKSCHSADIWCISHQGFWGFTFGFNLRNAMGVSARDTTNNLGKICSSVRYEGISRGLFNPVEVSQRNRIVI